MHITPNRRRVAILFLFSAIAVTTWVGVTVASMCVPALHVALTLVTALGTWLLCRDELAQGVDHNVIPVTLTGLAIGLGLTWLGAGVVALTGVAEGAHWTHGETATVIERFIEDTAFRWTPLGLIAGLMGTAASVILNELTGDAGSNQQTHA